MDLSEIYPINNKILFIGPYPPPLGGVSVHIKRLFQILKVKGCNVDIFDISKKYKFRNLIHLFQLICFNNYDIISIHGFYSKYILIILLLKPAKKFRIFYTDHNPRLFNSKNNLVSYFKKRYIERLDYLVLVGEHILENYKKCKVKLPKNAIVKNAFLPPPLKEENQILHTYSDKTKEFITKHKPIIIANAWQIVFHKGIDLYGLDLCVELTTKLKDKYPRVGLLFALANEGINAEYIYEIKEKLKELGIRNNFCFMTGQKELWPLFKKADLSIRPTITDGDALSIRESIYFNCPVVASDVVKRPEGTILFQSREIDDLYFHVCEILAAKVY